MLGLNSAVLLNVILKSAPSEMKSELKLDFTRPPSPSSSLIADPVLNPPHTSRYKGSFELLSVLSHWLIDECIQPTEPETLSLTVSQSIAQEGFQFNKTLTNNGLKHREALVNWLVSILQPERPSKVLGSFLPANLNKFPYCPSACHLHLSPLRYSWQPALGMKPQKGSSQLYRLQFHEHGACISC